MEFVVEIVAETRWLLVCLFGLLGVSIVFVLISIIRVDLWKEDGFVTYFVCMCVFNALVCRIQSVAIEWTFWGYV